MLDDLELRDRLPKRPAVLGVIHRVLEDAGRPRDRPRGGDHSLALELPHQVLEPFAFLADQVADRNSAVLE